MIANTDSVVTPSWIPTSGSSDSILYRWVTAHARMATLNEALSVFVPDADAYARLSASRREVSAALDALHAELLALPVDEREPMAHRIADACGVYFTGLDALDGLCDLAESYTDIHQIDYPGGAECFYQRFGVQQAEAGAYSVLPRPDVGEGIFSLSWRMPPIKDAPNVFRPDPRATHHFVQVSDCLAPGTTAPIVLAVAEVVTR